MTVAGRACSAAEEFVCDRRAGMVAGCERKPDADGPLESYTTSHHINHRDP